MTKPKFVVLTNKTRGIYFGELREEPGADGIAILHNVRHCFTFRCHPEAKGVWGLALRGPQQGSQIGPTLPKMTIHDIASFAECSDISVQEWQAAVWE